MHFQGNGQVYMNMYRNTLIYREKSIERERGGGTDTRIECGYTAILRYMYLKHFVAEFSKLAMSLQICIE